MSAGERLVRELLEQPEPAVFAARVSEATDEELAQGMRSDRGSDLVREIFNRMPSYLDRERAADVSGVVHWRVGDPSNWLAGYEVVLERGECSVGETLDREPTVSFEIEPVALLKLVAGSATGMDLMLARRLVVRGDVSFAMLTERLFTIGEEQSPEEA
jgi:hypothetical protein